MVLLMDILICILVLIMILINHNYVIPLHKDCRLADVKIIMIQSIILSKM